MSNIISAKAPGRINLIGEHTDYNNGYVLPAAINLCIETKLEANQTDHVHVEALDVKEVYSFNIKDNNADAAPSWAKYIFGVVKEMQKLGATIKGFNAQFGGNVPQGSGMSSSAALECSFAVALNDLFNSGLAPFDLIKAGQMAEHHYVGTKCGIMDQYASILGKKDQAIFLDCLHVKHQYVPLQFNDYSVLLLHTNIKHSLAESEYNERRAECEEGLHLLQKKIPTIKTFRDVHLNQLEMMGTTFSNTIYKRCKYVIEENERVLRAKAALQQNDLAQLGSLMQQSHQGLQHLYEVSCKQLDFLVDFTLNHPQILGSRMMGGGFGGCTISIIHSSVIDDFINNVSNAYYNLFDIELSPYIVSIEDGASVIPHES